MKTQNGYGILIPFGNDSHGKSCRDKCLLRLEEGGQKHGLYVVKVGYDKAHRTVMRVAYTVNGDQGTVVD